MNTHGDDDVEIPEVTDFSGFQRGRYARKPGEPLEIRVDGAIEYSLRLIPSNKVVGRFASTLDTWPAIVAEVERGIPPNCLVLDWHGPMGSMVRSAPAECSSPRLGQPLDPTPTAGRSAPPAESPTAANHLRTARHEARM